MVFSLLGMLLFRRFRSWVLPVFVIVPLYIYIIYSWYCYNYINGLGSRPMIHIYPLLAVPFTAFLQYVSMRGQIAKLSFCIGAAFCIALNLSYSVQQSTGMLNSEESSLVYNAGTLFRWHMRYNDLVLRDNHVFQPDTGALEKVQTLGMLNYDMPSSGHIPDTVTGKGNLLSLTNNEYPEEKISVVYSKGIFGSARWLKCSGRFMTLHFPTYYKHEMVLQFKRGNDVMRQKNCTIENKLDIAPPGRDTGTHRLKLARYVDHKWSTVSYFVDMPRYLRDGDSIILSLHNPGKEELLADNVQLDLYRKK